MTGEILPSPENPAAAKFVDFVETHARIILNAPEEGLVDPHITRQSDWMLTDRSQLVPIDKVRFQVIINLEDPSLFHQVIFSYQGEDVFFLGYDAQNAAFTATIGERREDTEFSSKQVEQLLDELAYRELSGSLLNPDNSMS